MSIGAGGFQIEKNIRRRRPSVLDPSGFGFRAQGGLGFKPLESLQEQE